MKIKLDLKTTSGRFTCLEIVLLALAMTAILGIAVSVVHSFDIFWQLQGGKYILSEMKMIYSDAFSLATDVSRKEHCWLHDVLFYLAYTVGGYPAISVFKGGVVVSVALMCVIVARVRGASWLAILIIMPTLMFLSRGGWLERPQLWTFLFIPLFLLILENRKKFGRKILYLLPLAMIFWANLHAGAAIGLPIIGAYLVGEGIVQFFKPRIFPLDSHYKKLLVTTPLVVVATLFTPYGSMILKTVYSQIKALLPAAGTGGRSISKAITTAYNMDWRLTTFASDPYFYFVFGIVCVLLVLGWRKFSLTDLFVLGGLSFMGFTLSRHVPVFFVGVAALLPSLADSAFSWITTRLPKKELLFPYLRVCGIILALAMLWLFGSSAHRTYGFFNTGLRTWHYPIEAAEFVSREKLPKNMYNTYDWGGYLMWTLYPEYKVFWDGRSTSRVMFKYGLDVMSAKPGWKDILNKFDVKTIVSKSCMVSNGQSYPILRVLGNDPEWALVFSDESSLIFVKVSEVDPAWLKRRRLPASRIENTILSEATLLVQVDPGRYMGWWEIAQIRLKRKEYGPAFQALEQYLRRSPVRNPTAENYYRQLLPLVKNGKITARRGK